MQQSLRLPLDSAMRESFTAEGKIVVWKGMETLVGLSRDESERLLRGFLSGAIRSVDDLEEGDFRRHNPRFQGDNFAKNLELVDRVEEIAGENDPFVRQIGHEIARGIAASHERDAHRSATQVDCLRRRDRAIDAVKLHQVALQRLRVGGRNEPIESSARRVGQRRPVRSLS